jgi:hypothetical protein
MTEELNFDSVYRSVHKGSETHPTFFPLSIGFFPFIKKPEALNDGKEPNTEGKGSWMGFRARVDTAGVEIQFFCYLEHIMLCAIQASHVSIT